MTGLLRALDRLLVRRDQRCAPSLLSERIDRMAAPEFVDLIRLEVEIAARDLDASNEDAVTPAGGRYLTRLRIRLDALVAYARASGVPVGDILDRYALGEVRHG